MANMENEAQIVRDQAPVVEQTLGEMIDIVDKLGETHEACQLVVDTLGIVADSLRNQIDSVTARQSSANHIHDTAQQTLGTIRPRLDPEDPASRELLQRGAHFETVSEQLQGTTNQLAGQGELRLAAMAAAADNLKQQVSDFVSDINAVYAQAEATGEVAASYSRDLGNFTLRGNIG
jgi:ABC-type transporter Mla subunit MlaD